MSNNPFGETAPLSNNPFVEDPSQAHNRYPAIAQASPTFAAPLGFGGGYQQFAAPQQSGFGSTLGATFGAPLGFQQQPQQQQPQLQYQPTGFFSPGIASGYGGSPFQSYGYGGSPLAPSLPISQANIPSHLQQFDPYAALQQGWQGQPGASSPQQQGPSTPQGLYSQGQYSGAAVGSFQGGTQSPVQPQGAGSSRADEHPRTWIRAHKAELESWDQASWKQAFNTFDALTAEWVKRREEASLRVQAVARGVLPAHEAQTWQNMLKDATANIDSIAASKIQMQEALAGYRHSSDLASKRRVKECLNAGLSNLPDWPQ